MRVQFEKGKQRKFLDLVRQRLRAPSVMAILQFGFSCSESGLKNFYSERRLLPEDLFEEMLHLAKIDKNDLDFGLIGENWGQVKGGRKSKRTRLKN